MQEIAERLEQIVQTLQSLDSRMQRIEKTLAGWEKTLSTASRRENNLLRRKQYREVKKRREEGMVPLPKRHVLRFRDKRLTPKLRGWAEAGMRFGRADQPEQFYTYLVHQWNNCSYLKKPITFSGSTFRIWNETHRFSYGPRDLMGYIERRSAVQVLRNPAEQQDFCKRPWWDWSYAVFRPVISEMEELGFDELPERFRRCCKIMIGGFGGYEVYTDLVWDFNESRENVNKMLKRVGTDLQLMLRAAFIGLRVKGPASPVQLP